MFNLVYSEILKLKRSSTILYLTLSSIFFPVVAFILTMIINHKPTWKEYVNNLEDVMFMAVGILIFTLLSSYVFLREYSDNTKRELYSHPISKMSIFTSKMLAIYIIIVLIYVLHFIIVFFGGLLALQEPLNKEFFFTHLRVNLESMILQFSIVPLLIFLTNIAKNFIVSTLVGVFALFVNAYTYITHNYEYCPFMLPYMPVLGFDTAVNINITAGLAIGVFIFGLIVCTFYFSMVEEL